MININCVSNKGHWILTSINQTSFIVANYFTVKFVLSRNISGNLRFAITIAILLPWIILVALYDLPSKKPMIFFFFQRTKKHKDLFNTELKNFYKYLFYFLQFNGNAFQVNSQECNLILIIFIKINYK